MIDCSIIYKHRREQLLKKLPIESPEDRIVLCAGSERNQHGRFIQDSTFFYFTGIDEPDVVLVIDPEGRDVLFVPRFEGRRALWMGSEITDKTPAFEYGVDRIYYLGAAWSGYSAGDLDKRECYLDFLHYIAKQRIAGGRLYIPTMPSWHGTFPQQFLAWLIDDVHMAPSQNVACVAEEIAALRRYKMGNEKMYIQEAIRRTAAAFKAAHAAIKPGMYEYEVRAIIDGTCIAQGSEFEAFPTIVGSGVNATILHRRHADKMLKDGELVLIDAGATSHYCRADISRTYPVSGKFTPRQRELYAAVLDTLRYAETLAKPGMYITNRERPELSINHLVRKYLETTYGLINVMPHSIGHFLGYDVHDVGDYRVPLQRGDVITLEPGIYLPHEGIGIRIEDDYEIGDDGNWCLSDMIPREIEEIER